MVWGGDAHDRDHVVLGLDVSRALTTGGVSGIGYATASMSFSAVQSEIDMNRVVLIRGQWDSGSGRLLVLRGYSATATTFSYSDPMRSYYQSGIRAWMLSGGRGNQHHVWTHARCGMTAQEVRP